MHSIKLLGHHLMNKVSNIIFIVKCNVSCTQTLTYL